VRHVSLFLFVSATICRLDLASSQITRENLPPNTVVITIDDLPYAKWQSGPGEPRLMDPRDRRLFCEQRSSGYMVRGRLPFPKPTTAAFPAAGERGMHGAA
jgi:hypothetical protein